jgi:hypothetical protein
MPQKRIYHLSFVLSEAELRAFENILDYAFCGEDDDLASVVLSSHHNALKTARRMHQKVKAAIRAEQEPKRWTLNGRRF